MCQSYRKSCVCGKHTAEIFFGKMVLDENAVSEVYCPECGCAVDSGASNRVWDNGWILELNMDLIKERSPVMGADPDSVTAEWVFDEGYATWVGITPDDAQTRDRERDEITRLAKSDIRAYLAAMKEWGLGRELRFSREGWRKMTRSNTN
jgi:hypothetical protein